MSSSSSVQLQLLGLPFSTYTRTITLALSAAGVAFDYEHMPPHDERLSAHTPFGLLPVMGHGDLTLYESRAIAGYLSAQLPALRPLFPADAAAAARAERWISLLSSQLFPLAEPRLVKARHALEKESVAEEEVVKKLQPAVDDMHALLEKLEPLVEADAGPWLVAGQKSWADYFVLPPLADLEATPEGKAIFGADTRAPNLTRWLRHMLELPESDKTHEGTVAQLRAAGKMGRK